MFNKYERCRFFRGQMDMLLSRQRERGHIVEVWGGGGGRRKVLTL